MTRWLKPLGFSNGGYINTHCFDVVGIPGYILNILQPMLQISKSVDHKQPADAPESNRIIFPSSCEHAKT